MNRFLKFIFNRSKDNDSRNFEQNLFTDYKFLTGSMTAKQLFNLCEIFEVIPEYLIVGNAQHLAKSMELAKYSIRLSQIEYTFPIFSLSVLKYPKSSIYCSMMYIIDEIEKNRDKNLHSILSGTNITIDTLHSSLFALSTIIDTLYNDVEETIKTYGSHTNEKLDDSLIYFKKIVTNDLPID